MTLVVQTDFLFDLMQASCVPVSCVAYVWEPNVYVDEDGLWSDMQIFYNILQGAAEKVLSFVTFLLWWTPYAGEIMFNASLKGVMMMMIESVSFMCRMCLRKVNVYEWRTPAQFMQSGGRRHTSAHQLGGTCQFCNFHLDTRDHFGPDLRLREERWKKWRFHLKQFRNSVLFATVLWGHFGRMGTSLSIAWQWTLRFLLLCGTK